MPPQSRSRRGSRWQTAPARFLLSDRLVRRSTRTAVRCTCGAAGCGGRRRAAHLADASSPEHLHARSLVAANGRRDHRGDGAVRAAGAWSHRLPSSAWMTTNSTTGETYRPLDLDGADQPFQLGLQAVDQRSAFRPADVLRACDDDLRTVSPGAGPHARFLVRRTQGGRGPSSCTFIPTPSRKTTPTTTPTPARSSLAIRLPTERPSAPTSPVASYSRRCRTTWSFTR